MSEPLQLVSRRRAAEECDTTIRTIIRRQKAGLLGFDQPIFIGPRVYFGRDRFEAGKRLGFPKASAQP
jgi:hypothetical protein